MARYETIRIVRAPEPEPEPEKMNDHPDQCTCPKCSDGHGSTFMDWWD